MTPLLSHQQLLDAKRLLFMTHMAIGDYVYQRMFLKKLAETYPHLSIDLWFDDCETLTNTWTVRRGKMLSEWFSDEPFLNKFYPVAASAEERKELIGRASQENYDIIVFSVDMLSEVYAEVARKISKNAYVVGTLSHPWRNMRQKIKAFVQCDDFYYTKNALARHKCHITEFYQKRFLKLFNLATTPEEIRPKMQIPDEWHQKMQSWLNQIKLNNQATKGTVFINYLASQDKRNWQFSQVIDLVISLNQIENHWTYIISLPPHMLKEIREKIHQEVGLKNIHVVPFSAQEHFYELPALIQLSDWVLSVETAAIHLASALDVPQIALVRYKARAWAPLKNKKTFVIYTKKSPVRIYNITVDQVLDVSKNLHHK